MPEIKAYSQAAGTGKYDKASGLSGKYDNVRRFWEDQMTGIFLRPMLNDLVDYKRQRLERLRILDIGCGSGDGFDLLMSVTSKDPGLYDYIFTALTPDMLQDYYGLDVNDNLLDQAREYYGHNPKMRFAKRDLANGLPADIRDERPFDVYFTSYGTMSHFTDDQAAKLIADISTHASGKSYFVGDWLGRYSWEWQDLWHESPDEEFFMDYRISYIFPPDDRERDDIPVFPLRLMTRDEVLKIIEKAEKMSGFRIKPVRFFDRSILIGRHLETCDYNQHCHNLRLPINSLFEGYVRTDLGQLMIDYVPRPGFEHLNKFYESFFLSCNTLVEHVISMLVNHSTGDYATPIEPYYPTPLKEAIQTMYRVIEGAGLLQYGDPRANIIETQLGFSLRKLEMDFQPGTGMGHGLVGIFEIEKD